MPRVLQSRKLWAAVVGLVFIVVNAFLNQEQIDPDTVTNAVMGIVAAYMAATAYEDGQKAKAADNKTTISTPGGSDVQVTAQDATVVPPSAASGRMGL